MLSNTISTLHMINLGDGRRMVGRVKPTHEGWVGGWVGEWVRRASGMVREVEAGQRGWQVEDTANFETGCARALEIHGKRGSPQARPSGRSQAQA